MVGRPLWARYVRVAAGWCQCGLPPRVGLGPPTVPRRTGHSTASRLPHATPSGFSSCLPHRPSNSRNARTRTHHPHRSIFFETEINFGSEGGLYAEHIFNRDFEALGRGRMPPTPNPTDQDSRAGQRRNATSAATPTGPPLDPGEPAAVATDYAPWVEQPTHPPLPNGDVCSKMFCAPMWPWWRGGALS